MFETTMTLDGMLQVVAAVGVALFAWWEATRDKRKASRDAQVLVDNLILTLFLQFSVWRAGNPAVARTMRNDFPTDTENAAFIEISKHARLVPLKLYKLLATAFVNQTETSLTNAQVEMYAYLNSKGLIVDGAPVPLYDATEIVQNDWKQKT